MHNTRPPSPTSTLRALDIGASTHRALSAYHLPPPSPQFSTWSTDAHKITDPHLAARLAPLYTDHSATERQQHAIFVAKMNLPNWGICADQAREAFACLLVLYDERKYAVQELGMSRITLWAEWYSACQKPERVRDEQLIGACESTILFMEGDYVLRLQDFVAEVYALLVGVDKALAKMVLEDLVECVGRSEVDGFVRRLETGVVGYEGVVRGSARYVRLADRGLGVDGNEEAYDEGFEDPEL